MINEIQFAIMISLMHSWQERLSCFDCNMKSCKPTPRGQGRVEVYLIVADLPGGVLRYISDGEVDEAKFLDPPKSAIRLKLDPRKVQWPRM